MYFLLCYEWVSKWVLFKFHYSTRSSTTLLLFTCPLCLSSVSVLVHAIIKITDYYATRDVYFFFFHWNLLYIFSIYLWIIRPIPIHIFMSMFRFTVVDATIQKILWYNQVFRSHPSTLWMMTFIQARGDCWCFDVLTKRHPYAYSVCIHIIQCDPYQMPMPSNTNKHIQWDDTTVSLFGIFYIRVKWSVIAICLHRKFRFLFLQCFDNVSNLSIQNALIHER